MTGRWAKRSPWCDSWERVIRISSTFLWSTLPARTWPPRSTASTSYGQAIEDLDAVLSSLLKACQKDGVILLVTADHGMSFKSAGSKGTHASGDASIRNESRLAPLLVFTGDAGKRSGTGGQECVAPTLLSLMECPDTLSLEDGVPLMSGNSPSLYLDNVGPAAGWKWDWLPYAAVAAIAALGLMAALRLLKRR